jgi:hypothetical protein
MSTKRLLVIALFAAGCDMHRAAGTGNPEVLFDDKKGTES